MRARATGMPVARVIFIRPGKQEMVVFYDKVYR